MHCFHELVCFYVNGLPVVAITVHHEGDQCIAYSLVLSACSFKVVHVQAAQNNKVNFVLAVNGQN
ncbi:MAG: hypothetical protein QXE06_07325 [Candidatus Bathyarchaeia archaeon]